SVGYDHLSISHFSPSSSSSPPPLASWQVSKVLCLSLFYLFIATIDIPVLLSSPHQVVAYLSIKILDSVSSVLDSWLVLVSTIPKPPNTLIPRLALAPPVSRSHTPLPFNCWDPFCDHGDPERPEAK
ncbi:hypothetical protein N7505_009639, partial [Penicillium chrysogenum]